MELLEMDQIVEHKETNFSIKNSKFLNFKASITGRLESINTEKKVKIVVPLKHLRNFWRTLDILLINCEISFILNWSENCVIASKATRDEDPNVDPSIPAINAPTDATFKIKDAKWYVSAVTLSAEDANKFLEQLKRGFKRTIKWNK